MSPILQLRIGLAVIGIIVWAYGVSVDHPRLRIVGMAFLAASLIMRFIRPKRRDAEDPAM
jgi:hypothetical protein